MTRRIVGSIIHFRSAYDLTKSMDHVRRTTLLQRIFQTFTGPYNQVKIKFIFLFLFFLMDSCSIGIVLKNLTDDTFSSLRVLRNYRSRPICLPIQDFQP